MVFSGQNPPPPPSCGSPDRPLASLATPRKLGTGRSQNGEVSRFLPDSDPIACPSPATRRYSGKEGAQPDLSGPRFKASSHEQQITGLPPAGSASILRPPGPILPDGAGSGLHLSSGACPSGLPASATRNGRWHRDTGAGRFAHRSRDPAIAVAAGLAPPRRPGPAPDRGCCRFAAPMAGTRSRPEISSRPQRSRSEGSGSLARAGREWDFQILSARIAERREPRRRRSASHGIADMAFRPARKQNPGREASGVLFQFRMDINKSRVMGSPGSKVWSAWGADEVSDLCLTPSKRRPQCDSPWLFRGSRSPKPTTTSLEHLLARAETGRSRRGRQEAPLRFRRAVPRSAHPCPRLRDPRARDGSGVQSGRGSKSEVPDELGHIGVPAASAICHATERTPPQPVDRARASPGM